MYSTEYEAKLQEILEKQLSVCFSGSSSAVSSSRLDFMSLFLLGLMSAKDVQYESVASQMSGDALEDSKVRRIQRFVADFELDYICVAIFLLSLLPNKKKLRLCIDRTEWSFGDTTHNVLVLSVYTHGVCLPLWFEPVNENGGCCDADDKMYMVMQCLELVGADRIACLMGDSEFIGEEWIGFLVKHKIIFYLDIRANQYFSYQAKRYTVEKYMVGKHKAELRDIHIFGQTLHIGIKRQKLGEKKKRKAFLAIVSNEPKPKGILQMYRKRWGIEVLFQSIKERGFRIESTHLKDPVRFRKLFALVCMAFTFAFHIGLSTHEYIPITVKKHGYKENSFFRHGKDIIRKWCNLKAKNDHIKLEKVFQYVIKIIEYQLFTRKFSNLKTTVM